MAEIRKQTGLQDETPFNLKWLDVEGKGEELEWREEGENVVEVERKDGGAGWEGEMRVIVEGGERVALRKKRKARFFVSLLLC